MALKFDMSKAYNRVEWSYLEAVLLKMGFNNKVTQLFMSCITSVTYSIYHAGRNFGSIKPERGLRQGDPLSSYLSLMCIEGLTALLHNYEQRNLIKGIKVARTSPVLSHMFFADDSYIFCSASRESATNIMQLLQIFETTSGQQINVGKSSIFFSKNTPNSLKQKLSQQLKFAEAGDQSFYLGLPNIVGRNKSSLFGFLKDKMHDRIQWWD